MPGGEKKYSPLQGMREKIESVAKERMGSLRDNDLKALMMWLEHKQLEVAMNIALEDDPVLNAKGRGAVEFVIALNSEVLEILIARSHAKAKSQSVEEEDDE